MNRKLKKSILVLMIFSVLIISIGAISAEDNDSFSETLTTDDAPADILEESSSNTLSEVENKTFTDLNTDISDKTEANLESNYVYSSGDSAYANGITIDRELTINGNGKTTFNPDGNLLFKIGTNGKLTLNDLTIVNSYTKPDAMIQNSGTLILNNVTFTVERHILSSVSSGAKFITIQNDGELLVNNSLFKDSNIYSDSISSSSKQISIYGLIYNNNQATIENTIFDNNDLVNPSSNKLGRTIDICAVLHNKNNMALNNVIIQNTDVIYVPSGNNHFEGIIFNEKGKLEINKSTIKDNTISFSSTNSNFKGVVYSEDTSSELIISNSIIINNKNTNENTEKQIIEYKGTADLNNNYWGTNSPNFSDLITGTAPTTYVNLTFTPEDVTVGEEKTFNITFKANDELITTLPDYNVTVNSNKIGSKDVEIKNGVGQYKYLTITAGEDTITVNGEEYHITINAAPAGTFTDLNNLINANDEVELYTDYVYQSNDSALQTGIPINKNVTINGNGYTINSTTLAQLFNVANTGKLILKNVTLITDYVITSSAASKGNILNKGEITFDGVTFTSKRIGSGNAIAAAIFSDTTGIITIKDSKFIDSISNYTGSSTTMPYGLIYNKGIMTIENSLFENNGVYSAGKTMTTQNGLIYNYKTLTVKNTTFKNNFITYDGTGNALINGIIYGAASTTNLYNNCTFEENVVSSKSTGTVTTYLAFGAICVKGGTISVTNSNFIKNSAWAGSAIAILPTTGSVTLISENNTYIENSNNYEGTNALGGCGGAIFIYHNSILDSKNDKFINNTAINGGAIYGRTYNANIANITVTNSIFEGNTAVNGSAIYRTNKTTVNNNYWGTNDPDFESLITDGTVSLTPENHIVMKIEGQTIVLPESKATYTVSFKTNDTDAVCELPDYTVDLSATNALSGDSVTITKGSATFTYSATLDEINDTIKASVGSSERASLDIAVKEDANATGTFKELDRFIRKADNELDLIKDYTFDSQIDSGLENGITINKTLIINGHGFKINSTDLAKLFTVTSTGNLTLKDVVLVSDYIKTGTYSSSRPEASFKNSGLVTFDNVTFTLNQNVNSTDAAFAAGISNLNTMEIINSKFVNSNINTNTAYCFGLIDNNGGTLNIENTIFDNNSIIENSTASTLYFNGLIYNMGTLAFDNVNITNNYMKTPSSSRGLIRAYTNSKITIYNSCFENNTVDSTGNNAPGTVIYAESGSLTITGSKFINNTGARSGGAIYVSINPTLVNNLFEKNVATENGGAIYLASGASQPVFINNTFKENKAINGGAIYSGYSLQSAKAYNFTANTFIANEATKYGGAVYAASIGSNIYPIENNVFINNSAVEKGGAIYSTGTLKITETLFEGNSAGEGAVIYTTKTTASTITYSIFDNNVVTSPTGTLIYYYGSSTANNNYWGTNTPDFDEIIAVNSGTKTIPTNIVIIVIDGSENINSSDVYTVSFKDNVTGDIVALQKYGVDITSSLNNVTPTSVVIDEGMTSFIYNAENSGTDTIRVIKNNAEITNLTINVDASKTPEFSITADDVDYGEALNFTFTVTEGPNGTNIYKWTIIKGDSELESGYVNENNEILYAKAYSAGNYTIKVEMKDVDGWKDLAVNDTFEIRLGQSSVEIAPVTEIITYPGAVNITYTETNGIASITVKDSNGNDVAFTTENNKIILTNLGAGTYTVNATIADSENFTGSSDEITFKVTKAGPNVIIIPVTETVTYPGNVNITYIEVNGTAVITVKDSNGNDIPFTTHDGKIILTNLEVDTYTVNATIPDSANLTGASDEITFTVSKAASSVSITPVTETVPYLGSVNITYTQENGTAVITVKDSNGNDVPFTTENNKIILTNLAAGTYTVNATIAESARFTGSSDEITFNVSKIESDIIITTTNLTVGGEVNVTVTIAGATGNITIVVDTDTKELPLIDGVAIYTIDSITAGTHNVTVFYPGDSTHELVHNSTKFTVEKLTTEINVENVTVDAGQDALIEFTIAPDATGNVFIDINGIKLFETLENGKFSHKFKELAIGIYNVTLSYEGDGKYKGCNDTFTITANGLNAGLKANVTSNNIIVGENVTINVEINPQTTGNVTVLIDNGIYPVTLTEGKGSISIPVLANGTYTAVVKFTGDKKFSANETSVEFRVNKKELPTDINITEEIPEGTTAPEFTIQLPSDATGDFTVTVDGIEYSQPLLNGSATVKVPELTPGNHTLSTAYSGDNYYNGFESGNSTLTIPKASIPGGEDAINLTSPEGSDSPTYSIKLPSDAKGNLTATVDGKDVYTQALVNGSASVTVNGLSQGDHNIVVSYSGDNKYSNLSKNTTYHVPVAKITENNDVNMLYTSKAPYKVRITVDGKAVGAGEIVAIKFNGATYNVKTDKDGYATLNIPDVKPQKAAYTITAEYKGVKVSNSVKVNSIVVAKNLKVKKSKKVNKIKVSLKKVNGKYLKGKKLTLKIKGKTLKAKTNSKGVAIFKVKKNVLKKLKVNKKYKYTVTYGKDVVSKKLTIKK